MSARPSILITGAARRVGAAMALYHARHGYDIALHYNHSDATQVQKAVEAAGASCQLFSHDLQDIAGIPAFMARVKSAMPTCVALVNNASIFEPANFMDTDEALFDRQFAVNFKAPFFLTQAFAKNFGTGCVINILDTDIVRNEPSHFAYLLSKKTLSEFTTMAARTLGPTLRVNAVAPGCMLPVNPADDSFERKMEQLVPMRSHPSLDELSEAVLWLIKQPRITGQTIFVDGGKHVL
jgi:pteridine reductase